jgi:hypothetical protein
LPDGRSVRFHGFIDHNANLDPRVQPKVKTMGPHFSDYGSYVKSFFLQFPAGLGTGMNARHRGADYGLQQGEAVPVRVTANIGVPPPVAPPAGYPRPAPGYQQSLSGGQQPLAQGPGSNFVPGMTYPQYNPADAANSQLGRIAPDGGAAPAPGFMPAGPELRSELATGQAAGAPNTSTNAAGASNSQGIRATPLTLDTSF